MRSALTRISSNNLIGLSSSTGCQSSNLALRLNDRNGFNIDPVIVRNYTRLAEVGRFKAKHSDEDIYEPGQPFIHRVFGYRGMTLFPWMARVHDWDLRKQFVDEHSVKSHSKKKKSDHESDSDAASESFSDENNSTPTSGFISQPTRLHPYYQVLIDARDCYFVSNRTQTEAVTFLGHVNNSKSVYSVKGLDYVAHEDIIPYISHEQHPIQHELHNKLFRRKEQTPSIPVGNNDGSLKFSPTGLLEGWKDKHPWLELSQVYRRTTENVRVTVIPFYLGHSIQDEISFYWWRYCVRLENLSDVSVQLRERHWKIFSQTNMLQTIKGRGVVGVEPVLSKHEPAYQYSSHVNLEDKSGRMWGTFKMQREDGYTFECEIPPFSLESSLDNVTPPTSKRFSPEDEEP